MEDKKYKSQGTIYESQKEYIATCLFCGSTENLKIYPHRKNNEMCGMIYSCCKIPENHKFFLMPSEVEDFAMIPQEIFDALTTKVARDISEKAARKTGYGSPTQRLYDAICYLRNEKLKLELKEPIFKRPVIDESLKVKKS